jgi:hypothetical protein
MNVSKLLTGFRNRNLVPVRISSPGGHRFDGRGGYGSPSPNSPGPKHASHD